MSPACRWANLPPRRRVLRQRRPLRLQSDREGAHAARPHEGKDAILLASQLVTVLQSVASREVNTLDSVVLSVTRIRRQYRNVLPESVELEGTLRTHSSEVQQRVKARVRSRPVSPAPLAHRLTSSGMPARRHWSMTPAGPTSPATWRPGRVPHPSRRSASRWRRFCGLSSAYSRAFVSIGSASEYGLHHPAFNPDERLIAPAALFRSAGGTGITTYLMDDRGRGNYV